MFCLSFESAVMKLLKIILAVMCLVSVAVKAADLPNVTFALSNDDEPNVLRVSKILLNEIAKRMNVKAKVIQLPSQRMTSMLKHGQIHAEVYRVKSYKNVLPNAILIEESITELPHYAYTTNPNIVVNGWNSLLPYTHVIVRGYQFSQAKLKHHKIHEVNNIVSAFNFVKAKRADIIVSSGLLGDKIMNMPEFKHSNLIKLDTPVDYLALHTFFSAKYPELAKKYEKALKAIKKEGLLSKLKQQLVLN
jgi:ABC-type amino acid transport substrate-binding protein